MNKDKKDECDIESYLGKQVSVTIEKKPINVILVNGEEHFNQPGLSVGFVHFANPNNLLECLGFAGVNTILEFIKETD